MTKRIENLESVKVLCGICEEFPIDTVFIPCVKSVPYVGNILVCLNFI